MPGVRLAAVSSGVNGERDDLALMVFDPSAVVAGVYTQSAFAAPPVWVAKEREKTSRGWLVNSGNANAATGEPGRKDAVALCQQTAAVLELEPQFATALFYWRYRREVAHGRTSSGDS